MAKVKDKNAITTWQSIKTVFGCVREYKKPSLVKRKFAGEGFYDL